jgi:Tfp pilus assembly protein PilF
MLLAEQGDSKSAEAELATAVRLDPGNPRILVRQGELYENAGQWSLAERTYRALQRERPNYWLGYNNCGNVLLLTGRYTEARDLFQIASAASPGSVLALTNRGEVNFRLGKVRDAEEIYRRSLAIKGTDFTLKLLGDLLRVKGDYSNALVCARGAVAQIPSNDVNWLSLADCYEAMGGHQREAKEAFERAMTEVSRLISDNGRLISDNPLNRAPLLRLALYKMKTGSKAEAQALVRKPELNRQLDLDSELLRVRVLELSGRRIEALQKIAACLRRGPVRFQLEAMKDLADLRRDPGYSRLFGHTN